MEWVETTGRSVDEALDHALDQLGVDEADIDYEILAEPRVGLFGRLRGEARVRARVQPLSREKPNDRRRRGRAPAQRRGETTKHRDRETGRPDRPEPGGPSRRRRRGRGGGGDRSAQDTRETTVDEEVAIEEQAETAVDFTRGLIEAFGADASVTSAIEDEEHVLVEVQGEDLGLLVGPRGATLAAIEELVRTVVQRSTAGASARVHVDVAGYRARRREALAEFSTNVAHQVLENGSDVALEPMTPADRKVVHDTVSEIDGVTTVSEGEEPRRRVVIRRA